MHTSHICNSVSCIVCCTCGCCSAVVGTRRKHSVLWTRIAHSTRMLCCCGKLLCSMAGNAWFLASYGWLPRTIHMMPGTMTLLANEHSCSMWALQIWGGQQVTFLSSCIRPVDTSYTHDWHDCSLLTNSPGMWVAWHCQTNIGSNSPGASSKL